MAHDTHFKKGELESPRLMSTALKVHIMLKNKCMSSESMQNIPFKVEGT